MAAHAVSSLDRWSSQVAADVGRLLTELSVSDQPGRYLPRTRGLTRAGHEMALGPSCLALKLAYTVGAWDALTPGMQDAWVGFIGAFQTPARVGTTGWDNGAFEDPARARYAATTRVGLSQQLWRWWRNRGPLSPADRVRLAETKQAVATLKQVGRQPVYPYLGLPESPRRFGRLLDRCDWASPWAAGGQTAAIAALLASRAPDLTPQHHAVLRSICLAQFDRRLDHETGAYFTGKRPSPAQLINGAMKVLTGLDWLGASIHAPDRLIDTCLSVTPASGACDLADAAYVLYRCAQQTSHRGDDVRRYVRALIDDIDRHRQPEGGFSFYSDGRAAPYYGVPMGNDEPGADLHGTCLLVWAAAMALDLLNERPASWRIIKP